MGGQRRPCRADGRRLAAVEDRQRPRGGDPGQRHRRREALPLEHAHRIARGAGRSGQRAQHGRPAGSAARTHRRRNPCRLPRPLLRHQRRHDARRTLQRDGRSHRQPVQPAGPQLHDRRRLCFGPGGPEHGRRRPHRPPIRRRHHRGRGSQHGGGRLRQVLQDRRTVGHRHAALRRGCRRLRDGRGRGAVCAQAARGCRTRWRPHLRRDPGRGRFQRRQGQGHHGAQSGGPEAGRAAGLGTGGGRSGHRLGHRSPRHQHAGRGCGRTGKPDRGLRRRRCPKAWCGAGLGQVQHRPPEGRRRHGRPLQDGAQRAREGAHTEPELPRSQPQCRLGPLALLREHRTA